MRASGDKGTLVSVWASWCKSCKKELPMLAGMAPALRAERVGFVFVSADGPDDREKAAAMWRELVPGQPGFIVRGALGPFKRALNPSWKGSLPSTFLFDDKATLRYFWPGPIFDYEVEPIVGMFLAGQPLVGPTRVENGPPPE
jgi:thiol-disulfide isomerase/thioredoxin